MLERLSEKFALKLVNAGIIPESDAEIYVYGFFQTVMLILNIITTLILGFAFGLIIPCIFLNLAYIPIRINAGGHHADTPLKCYINSTIMIAILLAVIKWVPVYRSVTLILFVISCVIMWILAKDAIMITMWSIYLINAFYGYFVWTRLGDESV